MLVSTYTHATDTLKVKKLRFFIEPKAILSIPRPSYSTFNIDNGGMDGWIRGSYNDHHIITLNYGLSSGLSIRLSKYFRYEVSLTYQHYKLYTKETEISESYSYFYGSSSYNGTNNYRAWYNFLGISNGLSFAYKKLIVTNSIIAYLFVTERNQSDGHNNLNNSSYSQTTSGNTVNHPNTGGGYYALMSEHKIGYSLFKNRIESYIGINIPFLNSETLMFFGKKGIIPSISLKINF